MARLDPARAREPSTEDWRWLGGLLDRAGRSPALRHALCDLGYGADSLRRGLCSQLHVSARQLEHPDADAVAHGRRDRVAILLATVLDPSVAWPSDWLAAAARRWLAAAPVLYEIDTHTLERWLRDDAELGRSLAPAIAREGLALLGPDVLRRLADHAPASTRTLAAAWVARLERPR